MIYFFILQEMPFFVGLYTLIILMDKGKTN